MKADQETRLRRGVQRNPSSLAHDDRRPEDTDGQLSREGSREKLRGKSITGGGTTGNERLTATTGLALILLLAALGVTIVRIGPLISPHLFIGMMLIPPVILKMGSTGYRFVRYYAADPVYRKRGAPPLPLRLIAPFVVASSLAVFATGVALLIVGPDSAGVLRGLHKASFIVWIVFMALHVLGHLPDLQKTFLIRRGGHMEYNEFAAGRVGRAIALASALTVGVVLAVVLIPYFGSWSHFEAFHHH